MTNKQDLLSKLAEMYNEPIQALMEEPEDAVKREVGGELLESSSSLAILEIFYEHFLFTSVSA